MMGHRRSLSQPPEDLQAQAVIFHRSGQFLGNNEYAAPQRQHAKSNMSNQRGANSRYQPYTKQVSSKRASPRRYKLRKSEMTSTNDISQTLLPRAMIPYDLNGNDEEVARRSVTNDTILHSITSAPMLMERGHNFVSSSGTSHQQSDRTGQFLSTSEVRNQLRVIVKGCERLESLLESPVTKCNPQETDPETEK
jgi:hypothetical protein